MIIDNLPIRNRNFIVIGSYALGTRDYKDIDIICYYNDIEVECVKSTPFIASFKHEGIRIECLLADEMESLQEILKHKVWLSVDNIATTKCQLIIKAGHIIYPNRQWEKHISDYHQLQKILGGLSKFISEDPLIKLHRQCTKKHQQRYRTPRLKNTKLEEFFDDGVIKYVEHDLIHTWMAHKEKPMYTYMQKDPTEVDCSEELWNNFSQVEKDQCVMEEAYTIASERLLIPYKVNDNRILTDHEAFKWALMRICTTLCSGWFREWAIDGYFRILRSYNRQYADKIQWDKVNYNAKEEFDQRRRSKIKNGGESLRGGIRGDS